MKTTRRITLAKVLNLRKVGVTFLALIALGLLVAGVASVYAQFGGGYDLTWNTADKGSWVALRIALKRLCHDRFMRLPYQIVQDSRPKKKP